MVARREFACLSLVLAAVVLPFVLCQDREAADKRPIYKSPLGLAISPNGQVAFVALHTSDALAAVDLRQGRVLWELRVGKKPYDVALHRGIAYVTCEADDTLVAVDVAARKIERVFKVGQAPRGVSVDPKTGLIHVVCHDERVMWIGNGTTTPHKVPIPPQPSGNYVRAANLELAVGEEQIAYRRTNRPSHLFTVGQSISDPKQEAVKPDPKRTAFDPMQDIDYSRSSMDLSAHTRPDVFWMFWTPPADPNSSIRLAPGKLFTTSFSFLLSRPQILAGVFHQANMAVVMLDQPDEGYPEPTDVIVKLPVGKTGLVFAKYGKADTHPLRGAKAFISSGGADKVIVLDLHKAAKHAEAHVPKGGMGMGMGMYGMGMGGMGQARGVGFQAFGMNMGGSGTSVAMNADLRASASYTLARLPTMANPRRMALTPDGMGLVVSNHLADSLTVIDTLKLSVIRHIDLGGPKPDLARRGEILFHSAKHTVQQRFTCASCHPSNGADGLTWNLSSDGHGESLNTRALFGVRDTGPFGWRGESKTLEDRVRNTMRTLHKHQLSNTDAAAIAAYLRTIDPPRPLPKKEEDLPAIARGKEIFFGKGNCKSCHKGDAYTSENRRAVILDQNQKLTPFDVPSLRGVARTAPYLHDGRAVTLEDIFLKHNSEKRHGQAHELTRPELNDLIAFLKSL